MKKSLDSQKCSIHYTEDKSDNKVYNCCICGKMTHLFSTYTRDNKYYCNDCFHIDHKVIKTRYKKGIIREDIEDASSVVFNRNDLCDVRMDFHTGVCDNQEALYNRISGQFLGTLAFGYHLITIGI